MQNKTHIIKPKKERMVNFEYYYVLICKAPLQQRSTIPSMLTFCKSLLPSAYYWPCPSLCRIMALQKCT